MNSDTDNQTQQPKTYPELAQTLIDNGYDIAPCWGADNTWEFL